MSAGVESELEKIIGNGDAGDNKVANDDTDDSNVKPKVKTKTIEKKSDRVIYARKEGEGGASGSVLEAGEKITLDQASQLKELVWGSANMPPKNEWLKPGLKIMPSEDLFAYGIKCPRNGTKNFLLCLQAYLLKHLLFEKSKGGKAGSVSKQKEASRRQGGKSQSVPNGIMASQKEDYKQKDREARRNQKEKVKWSQLLKPLEKNQIDMVVGGISEVLIKVAEGKEATLALPGPETCFEATGQYGIDGVTEKLHLFRCKKEEDMRTHVRRYVNNILDDKGSGVLSILYSVLLSRGFDRLTKDMQDKADDCMIDPMGECTQAMLNLIIFGVATPYLHNGTIVLGDIEEGKGEDRHGVIQRNDIGFLIYDKDDLRTAQHNLGSRLKTPLLPIWITKCNEQVGVLFNPNRELMRSYHAENRFQLYYYANADFKKEERKETILTIDTRSSKNIVSVNANDDFDDAKEPALQLAIKTKWQGADVDWNEVTPYVW